MTAEAEFQGWDPETAYLMLNPTYIYEFVNNDTTFSVAKIGQILKDSKTIPVESKHLSQGGD